MITQVADKHFQQKEYTLSDQKGWQSIKFDLPQTAQTIELKITDVYAGRKYKDTCLDEFRLLYKGKVIPFKNVDTIKTQQKEISLQMLNSGFEEKFKALFGVAAGTNYVDSNKKYLFLKAVDGNSSDMVMVANVRGGNFDLVSVKNATFSSKKNDSYTKSVAEEIYRNNRNVEDVCFYSDYSMNGESYELGNCKIVKTSYISYIETHTAQIVRIDGDNIYVNGVHYKVAPASKVYAYCD